MAIPPVSVEQTYQEMQRRLSKLVPDVEIRLKAELAYEINRLKKERGAIILGHNYMEPALYYSVADVVGDSLELSRKAAETTCDPIIFCGVRFMAETAKILNPTRTVLLPAKKAGCSLAESISVEDVRALKAAYPGSPIVTYINTYADIKAEVDICCTSGNAARVVQSLNAEQVIFIPDEYLAGNVAEEIGRSIAWVSREDLRRGNIPQAQMIGWKGRCEVHEKFTVEDITQVRRQFPKVEVLAHPECSPAVVAASDFSASTSKMVSHVKQSKSPHFLILTECSMGDNIIADNPDKDVLRLCSIRCPHMNEITLEDTLSALRNNQQVIEVPEKIIKLARVSLERMLAIR